MIFLLWFYRNAYYIPNTCDIHMTHAHIYLEEKFENDIKKRVPKKLTWRDTSKYEKDQTSSEYIEEVRTTYNN